MIKTPSTNRDSYLLVGANLMVALLGVVTQYLILVSLDAIEYGIWVLLLDATLTIGMLVDFGIPDAIIRLWDGSSEDVNRAVVRGIFGQTTIATFVLLLSIPICIIIGFERVSSISLILMVAGSILLYQLGSLRIGLRMLGRADEESLALVVDRLLFIISIYISINFRPSIQNLSIAFFSAAALSFSYTAWRYLSNSVITEENEQDGHSNSLREVVSIIIAASPFALSLLIFPLFGRVDKFIIAWSGSLEEVAYFNIPWLVILSGLAVPKSIRQAALADLGTKKNDISAQFLLVQKSWPFSSILLWIGVPACIIISKLVFENIFPESLTSPDGYIFSGLKLLFCLLPAWIWSMAGALELEILKLDKSPIKYSSIICFSLIMNLVVGLLLIPRFGLIGAALSSSAGFLALFVISFTFGPFYGSDFSSLFIEKFSHGMIYSCILLGLAVGPEYAEINLSFTHSIIFLMTLTLPIMLKSSLPFIRESINHFRNYRESQLS